MFKKLTFCLLSLSGFGFASDYYICENVNDVDEWVIEIDLQKGRASFFDNDSWTKTSMSGSFSSIDHNCSQKIYVFDNKTTEEGLREATMIRFNQTKLTASITLDDITWLAVGGCKAIARPEISSAE